MSFYLDTSFLIAVLADEPLSDASRAWLKAVDAPTIVSTFAALEFAASTARFVRTGRMAEDGARQMLARFDEFRAASASYGHDNLDYRRADELVRDFTTKLAAPDALHLACVINIGATLVTFDQRLAEAAKGRGVAVTTPG